MHKFKIVSDVNTFHISNIYSQFKKEVISYFNRYSQFEFVPLDNIAVGEKYIVFLNYYEDFVHKSSTDKRNYYNFLSQDTRNDLSASDANRNVCFVYPMPARVWEDSGKGLVKWIICNHTESPTIDQLFNVNGLQCALNSQPQNIIYMVGSIIDTDFNNVKNYTLNRYNIQTLHWNVVKHFIDINNRDRYFHVVNERLWNIKNKKILPHKSICYNRGPRLHRIIIISHIVANKELYNDCNYSLGMSLLSDFYYPSIRRTDFYQDHLSDSQFITHHNMEYLIPACKYVCSLTNDIKIYNEDDINLVINQAHVVNYTHAKDTSFHIVTETCSTNRAQFITEKSYKPFMMMQPFIQYGDYKNLSILRDKGYKTFDKWIDQSYDDIENDADRMFAFLKEMDRLQSISKEEWADILYDMQDDLMHNLAYVSTAEFVTPMNKLTSILLDFYESR